jgi:hypothetical protein
LAFLSFGYATEEFEVTDERLGVYRPEEHIDNPKDYADNQDATKYDGRLRGPIQKAELEVDHNTGMKNYIANETGGWATSTGYVKFSLSRSIHFGRVYTHGAGSTHGREADLCEALRCLGQGLHCLEVISSHHRKLPANEDDRILVPIPITANLPCESWVSVKSSHTPETLQRLTYAAKGFSLSQPALLVLLISCIV